jgi:hypothetical protein
MEGLVATVLVCLSLTAAGVAQTPPASPAIAEFNTKVAAYMALAKQLGESLPPLKRTDDAGEIAARELAHGVAIRTSRSAARPGDVFTAGAAKTFRRMIKADVRQRSAHRRKLVFDEIPHFHPKIGQTYPGDSALATFPATLLDSQELDGLRIMMALVNNWDLKEINNTILEIAGERRYMVADLGASFGNTGNSLTRSKSAPQEYADTTFVATASGGFVDFVLHSRPFILSAINLPNYQTRTRMEDVAKKIPRAHAQWLGRRLSMLSAKQIGDAFRGAGYTADEIAVYAPAVLKRIAELNAM